MSGSANVRANRYSPRPSTKAITASEAGGRRSSPRAGPGVTAADPAAPRSRSRSGYAEACPVMGNGRGRGHADPLQGGKVGSTEERGQRILVEQHPARLETEQVVRGKEAAHERELGIVLAQQGLPVVLAELEVEVLVVDPIGVG